MALVPQSVAYLDPLMQVDAQVRGGKPDREKIARQKQVFRRLYLDESTEKLYPFQLSGGMARRVLVSTAVVSGAEVIIADEPTPGLDLAMAMEALRIFRELADEGRAVVLITHDIDLAFHVADRIAVFYAGTTVEIAEAADFRRGPEALPRMVFSPFQDSSPMRRICQRDVCFLLDVPIRLRSVRRRYP